MAVQIIEVKTKKQLKLWVDFPNKLYKNNPYYVPFLFSDEINTFTKTRNPAYDFCDTKLFLAYQDKKIVGRIAALINHAYNKKWNKSAIRFTRFDFIDDYEVSKALFDEVIKWGHENNLNQAMGPIGFTDLDHEGMLVEGYEEMNMSITFYNHPYYIKHMEKLGLRKDADWIEFKVFIPDQLDERVEKVSSYLIKKHGYQVITYKDRKTLMKDAYEGFNVIDKAFSELYGTVPLTDRVIDTAIKDNISLINMDYVAAVKDKNNELIGFGFLVPSIAKALKKSNGRLFPFGALRMIKALKHNKVLEMYLVAVKKEYQKQGIVAILLETLIKVCIKNGVEYCESGPELETNEKVQSMWKGLKTQQHKRRRCWIKEI